MSPRSLLPLISVVLLLVVAGACRGFGETSPPSIVLISVDTLRADHLSAYGYDRPTKNMDALAAEGVLFLEAHSTTPWTLPSHMSLLTGRFASSHGVVDDNHALDASIPTLGEALMRAGYRTAGFVAHHYLSRNYGFARGFGEGNYIYTQYLNDPRQPHQTVRGDVVVRTAGAYLDRTRDDPRPYFLFVHLLDPHWTYGAPPPFRGRYSAGYTGPVTGALGNIIPLIARKRPLPPEDLQHLIDLYDEEIAFVDELIGRLVSKIRSLPGGERTVILLTSDHGEEFQEHGSLGHAVTLYREQTHVPLIVVDPGNPHPGLRVRSAVRGVDIAPTICLIADVPRDDPFLLSAEGVPLQIHLQEGVDPPELPVIVETTRYGHPRAALAVGDRKAIASMDYDWIGTRFTQAGPKKIVAATWRRDLELYDVVTDPRETVPLLDEGDTRAVVELRHWEERAWRGLLLEIRTTGEWSVALEFPDGARWLDEPWIHDGIRARRLQIEEQRIVLADLVAGTAYRVLLPLSIEEGQPAYVTVEGLRGVAVYDAGGESFSVGPGERRRVDPSRSDLRSDASPLPEGGTRVRVRARPYTARTEPPPIDPEVEKMLNSLGYVSR